MTMTEEQERALRDFNRARDNVLKGIGGKAATGYEKTYGSAYQLCVRLGLFPQIRAKYRG